MNEWSLFKEIVCTGWNGLVAQGLDSLIFHPWGPRFESGIDKSLENFKHHPLVSLLDIKTNYLKIHLFFVELLKNAAAWIFTDFSRNKKRFKRQVAPSRKTLRNPLDLIE